MDGFAQCQLRCKEDTRAYMLECGFFLSIRNRLVYYRPIFTYQPRVHNLLSHRLVGPLAGCRLIYPYQALKYLLNPLSLARGSSSLTSYVMY